MSKCLTYLALFGPQKVHRQATNFLQADLSAANVTTSFWIWFCSLISRFNVFLHVYCGLTPFVLSLSCSGSRLPGMRSTLPYHCYQRVLTTSATDCWPVLCQKWFSLTCSNVYFYVLACILFSVSSLFFEASILINSLYKFLRNSALCKFSCALKNKNKLNLSLGR